MRHAHHEDRLGGQVYLPRIRTSTMDAFCLPGSFNCERFWTRLRSMSVVVTKWEKRLGMCNFDSFGMRRGNKIVWMHMKMYVASKKHSKQHILRHFASSLHTLFSVFIHHKQYGTFLALDHPTLTLVLSWDSRIGVPGPLTVLTLTTSRIVLIRRYLISNLQFSDSKGLKHLKVPLRTCDVNGNLPIFKSYTKTIVITWWYYIILFCAQQLPHFSGAKSCFKMTL